VYLDGHFFLAGATKREKSERKRTRPANGAALSPPSDGAEDNLVPFSDVESPWLDLGGAEDGSEALENGRGGEEPVLTTNRVVRSCQATTVPILKMEESSEGNSY